MEHVCVFRLKLKLLWKDSRYLHWGFYQTLKPGIWVNRSIFCQGCSFCINSNCSSSFPEKKKRKKIRNVIHFLKMQKWLWNLLRVVATPEVEIREISWTSGNLQLVESQWRIGGQTRVMFLLLSPTTDVVRAIIRDGISSWMNFSPDCSMASIEEIIVLQLHPVTWDSCCCARWCPNVQNQHPSSTFQHLQHKRWIEHIFRDCGQDSRVALAAKSSTELQSDLPPFRSHNIRSCGFPWLLPVLSGCV